MPCPCCAGHGGFDAWDKPAKRGSFHYKFDCAGCEGRSAVPVGSHPCHPCRGQGGVSAFNDPCRVGAIHYRSACTACKGKCLILPAARAPAPRSAAVVGKVTPTCGAPAPPRRGSASTLHERGSVQCGTDRTGWLKGLNPMYAQCEDFPGTLGPGAVIALRDVQHADPTTGWVRMEPNGTINAKGKSSEGSPNWPGGWARWTVHAAGAGGLKLRSNTPGLGKKAGFVSIKSSGAIEEGRGGAHCDFNFVFNKDQGTVVINSVKHATSGLGFLPTLEKAANANNVSREPAHRNQFKVAFEGVGHLVHGAKVHLRNVKSGKNVRLKANGEINANGGDGAMATWNVFHNPVNGIFKFSNKNGFLALDCGVLRSGKGGKWCAMNVLPVDRSDGDHPLVTIRSAQAALGDKAGLGFDLTGQIRAPNKTGMGDHAQFIVIPAK